MFDDLPETRSRGAVLGRGAVSTSVLVHALLLGAAVVLSLLATVSVGEERAQFIGIFVASHQASPPPLGDSFLAGGPRKTPQPPKPTAPSPPDAKFTQPLDVSEPPLEPLPTKGPIPPIPIGSVLTGTGDLGEEGDGTGLGVGPGPGGPGIYGDRSGVLGGTGTRPGPGGPREGEPLQIGGAVQKPVLLRRVEPVYPRIAILGKRQGMVLLEGIIGTDGRVESIRFLTSDPVFDSAARSAVEKWLYAPATLDGRPVKVYLTIRVEFHLD